MTPPKTPKTALSDAFCIAGIPLQVLHYAGEWGIDAFGKVCTDWQQLVAENRCVLLAVLPRAEYLSRASVKSTPMPRFLWPASMSLRGAGSMLVAGQLRLHSGGSSPSASQRTWKAVSSEERPLSGFPQTILDPSSAGLIPPPSAGWACHGAAVAAVEGQLYLCGGWDEDENDSETSELWDPKTEEWIPMPKAPPQVACRMWEAAGIRTSQLSICTSTPKEIRTCPNSLQSVLPRPRFQHDQNVTSCVWRFNAETGSWAPLQSLLQSRAEAAVGILDGHIYLCGGMDNSGVLASCERYDPAANAWEALPSLRCPRAWAAAGVAGGLLHVCGGFDKDSNPVATAECFNPVTHAWEFAESVSFRKADAGFSLAQPSI